jgi:broad specificity phosphatase PhoE
MPVITIIRHAEAAHNAAFDLLNNDIVFQDPKHQDASITEKGIQQAQEVGKNLEMTSFDAVFCSPLTRCIQTMECILPLEKRNSIPVTLHDNLLEKQSAKHICNKRKTRDELVELYPQYEIITNSSDPKVWPYPESTDSVHNRMSVLINTIKKTHQADENILLVSHYNSILALTGIQLPNCGRLIMKC